MFDKLFSDGLCAKCKFGHLIKVWRKPPYNERVVTGEGEYASIIRCEKGFCINGDTHEEIVEECEFYEKKE